MAYTAFMIELGERLVKDREITEASAGMYLRSLYTMNGKNVFSNLAFLKDMEKVDATIEKYADSTRLSLYVAAVCALQFFKDRLGYKKVYNAYYAKMIEMRDGKKSEDAKNEKTLKQKENWIEWADVLKRYDELKKEVETFNTKKAISIKEYNALLHFTVLSLYTLVPVRRNLDYLHMYVVPSFTADLDKEKNYYSLDDHKFHFNRFKTAKTASEAEKVLDVPADLQSVLTSYMKYNPIAKGKKKEVKLLVEVDGTPILIQNAITRILNKIFKKRVSSSMLRHSFLSGKYGKVLEDMKETSLAMAHGLNTQRDYIKLDSTAPE
jgi:hypothetical protein